MTARSEKLNLNDLIIENYPLKIERIDNIDEGKAFSNSPLMHRGQLKFLFKDSQNGKCDVKAFNFPMYAIIQKN